MSHPAFTLLLAILLAAALAAVEDRTPRERCYAALRVFVCCVVFAVAGGWAMQLIHG